MPNINDTDIKILGKVQKRNLVACNDNGIKSQKKIALKEFFETCHSDVISEVSTVTAIHQWRICVKDPGDKERYTSHILDTDITPGGRILGLDSLIKSLKFFSQQGSFISTYKFTL